MTTEQTFGYQPGRLNAGYIRRVWLLLEKDVLEIIDPADFGDPASPVPAGGLLTHPDALITSLRPPPRTATFDETSLPDRAGPYFVPTLQIPIPRPTAAFDAFLTRHQAARWVIFWLDYNDQAWLAGEPGNGLRLALQRKQAEANALQLVFTGKSFHPAWRLQTTNLEELFLAPEFDLSFDLSFNTTE